MTNLELEKRLDVLVKNERQITNEILNLINLADSRKLYLERGYSSLFTWLTSSYQYSESAAQRRIQAARLLKSVPEVAQKISSGEVNLSTLAKTQSLIRIQERISGKKLSLADKAEVVRKIENKSSLVVEKTLQNLFPEASSKKTKEHKSAMPNDITRLSLNFSDETMRELERAKDILSHSLPNGLLSEVIDYLLKDFLKRKDPLRKNTKTPILDSSKNKLRCNTQMRGLKNTAATKRRVNVPLELRRLVLQKAQGRCEFVDASTRKICGSTYLPEIDHVYPVALGGGNDIDNLRCLCRQHNLFVAEKVFNFTQPHCKSV